MLIDNLTLKRVGERNELSANINGFRVWMRAPIDVPLIESPEPFLACGFLEALSLGKTVKIESQIGVSEQLLTNLEELNLIYCNWNRDLKPVRVNCKSTPAREPRPGLATMYSAGVDSMFTLLRHESRITHLLRLFGYDLGETPDEIARVIDHDRMYADRLGKQYIPIETNFQEYRIGRNIDNESFWGFPLYAAALALGFETHLIPSTYVYSGLFPATSHPLTDPLWGNGQTRIIHDILIRRSEKIRQIVKVPDALANLHVCWNRPIENCGKCSKCIGTGVTLRLLGINADSFPVSLAVEKLKGLHISDESRLTFFEDNLILAQEQQNSDIERILLRAIRRYIRAQLVPQLDRAFTNGVLRRLYRRWRKPDWLSEISLVPKERPY